jgi:hypothetical protein
MRKGSEAERAKDTIKSGHYSLPATAKGSTQMPLGSKIEVNEVQCVSQKREQFCIFRFNIDYLVAMAPDYCVLCQELHMITFTCIR